jgi:hypothetical protein
VAIAEGRTGMLTLLSAVALTSAVFAGVALETGRLSAVRLAAFQFAEVG